MPSGIPAIMQVLFNRSILSTREEMLSGTYYQPKQSKSMLRNLASGIYSYTIGSFWSEPEPEPAKETYVVVEFLDRQADQLLNWASKTENNLHSEASLKRQLRKSTTHSEADIQLLFNHLVRTGRMLVDQIGQGEDPELMMCKLAPVKSPSCDPITIKEKAKFALNVHLKKLDLRI